MGATHIIAGVDNGDSARLLRPAGVASVAFFFCVALIAGGVLSRVIPVAIAQLNAPFDQVYESPNLATIRAIRAGSNIYDSRLYLEPPFTLTAYTPLYHYVVAAFPASVRNPFFTGRLLALGFMLGAAAIPIWLDRGRRGAFAGVLAAGVFLFLWPVTANLAFMKSDSMALVLSALAVVVAVGAATSPTRIVVAAALCTLAVAAKQPYVSAGAACFISLIGTRRRAGLLFAASVLAFAAALGCVGYFMWGDGLRHCVTQLAWAPPRWAQFRSAAAGVIHQPLFCAVIVPLCVAVAATALVRPARFLTSPLGMYAVASWGVLVATLGKPGSSGNYFLEPCLATLMFAVASQTLPPRSYDWRLKTAAVSVVAILIVIDLRRTPVVMYSFVTNAIIEARLKTIATRNVEFGRTTQDSHILNLAVATLGAELPGQVSVNDPWLYLLLWNSGKLPETTLVRGLNERYYDAVVIPTDCGSITYPCASRIRCALWDCATAAPVRRIMAAVDAQYADRGDGTHPSCDLPTCELWTDIAILFPRQATVAREGTTTRASMLRQGHPPSLRGGHGLAY